jgi:hypothetical protein
MPRRPAEFALAEKAARLGLAEAARQAGLPADWRRWHRCKRLRGHRAQRFWLFTLKALAFIAVRSGRPDEARALLDQIARLDPQASVGGEVIASLLASVAGPAPDDARAPSGACSGREAEQLGLGLAVHPQPAQRGRHQRAHAEPQGLVARRPSSRSAMPMPRQPAQSISGMACMALPGRSRSMAASTPSWRVTSPRVRREPSSSPSSSPSVSVSTAAPASSMDPNIAAVIMRASCLVLSTGRAGLMPGPAR